VNEGLLRWLALAETLDGAHPTEAITMPKSASYHFWPRWFETDCAGCEPDVAVTVNIHDGSAWLLCIEAKYRSGKSSEGDVDSDVPIDQLAREWNNLIREAKKLNSQPLLIYVTADYTIPRHEIQSSLADFQRTQPCTAQPIIAWVSWRSIPLLFENSPTALLSDLARLMRRLGLTVFEGVHVSQEIWSPNWTFSPDDPPHLAGHPFAWTMRTDDDHVLWRFSK
jgi:hypothetical protein